MPFTTNPNNKYTVSIITDPTGGDGLSTPSGYESVYVMEIIPNLGEVIIAGDLTIDSNAFQPGFPPQPSLHSITPVNGLFQLQEYAMPNPAGHPEIDVIGLYEVYEDDNGNEWDLIQGPQPSITINTNPIKLRLYISLTTSFTTTIPVADTNILLDIDLASLTPIYGCTDPTQFNYDPLANTDDGSCIPIVIGCMDTTSDTYDATANTSDATLCEYWGCIDTGATNSSTSYTHDCGGNLTSIDTTCCQYAGACNTPINLTSGAISLNYDSPNNVDCSGMPGSTDDSCCHYAVPDCLDNTAINYHYNVANNTVNGVAFDIDCNGDLNGTDYNCCNYITNSCTDSTADNYDSAGTHDCNGDDITDSAYVQASGWDSCCTYTIDGCMDDANGGPDIFSFPGFAGNPNTTFNSRWINTNTYNFCVGFVAPGTSPQWQIFQGITACFFGNGYEYENYNPDATVTINNNCIKGGCMDDGTLDATAGDPYTSPYPNVVTPNYDSRATYDNGTCVYMGCMDPNSSNYDSSANVDSLLTTTIQVRQFLEGNHVIPPTPTYDPVNGVVGDCAGGYNFGCTDATSSNYDATATIDDGSCCDDGCMDDGSLLIANGDPYDSPYPGQAADNYDASHTCDDGTYCTYTNITAGCMSPTAFNYDPTALTDDGSCYWEGCAETAVTFGGSLAATNYLHDCQGVDRSSAFYINPLSSFNPSAECDVQTNYPGTRNNACEYQCPTYTATVDSSTGGIVIDIDATNMPNVGYPTIEVRFRYGEVGTQVNTWKGYSVRARLSAATAQLTYDRASGWTYDPAGVIGISSNFPGSNTAIWKHYSTAMQPITFSNTPNEVAYNINASGFVGKLNQINAPLPNFGWYFNSSGGMATCRQTLFPAGFAYRLGCTDPNADPIPSGQTWALGSYDPNADIDDGTCIITPTCSCATNYTISQSLVIDACGARLIAIVDNTTTDPTCIPCEFPSSISLIVDPNGTNPSGFTWTNHTYTQATSFYNNFGSLWFQSGQHYANTPLKIWDANGTLWGGLGNNFSMITDFPILLEWQLTTNPNGPEINTDSTSPEYDYDINGKKFYTKLEFASFSPVTSSPLTASYTPSVGCGNSDAINYDSNATCTFSSVSGCYFCPDTTNAYATLGSTPGLGPRNIVYDLTQNIQKTGHSSNPVYSVAHDSTAPPAIPPDLYGLSYTNVNTSTPGNVLNAWDATTTSTSGNLTTLSYSPGGVPASIADLSDPTVSAYPSGHTILGLDGITYNCDTYPSSSHQVDLSLGWLDLSGTVDCSVSNTYGGSTPELFYAAFGCTDSNAINYSACATIDDGSCIAQINGCTCSAAINYFPGANVDDGSCIYVGGVDPSYTPGIFPTYYSSNPYATSNSDVAGCFCADAVFDVAQYVCGDHQSVFTSYGTHIQYDASNTPHQITTTSSGIPATNQYTNAALTFADHPCGLGGATGIEADNGYNCANLVPQATINDGTC